MIIRKRIFAYQCLKCQTLFHTGPKTRDGKIIPGFVALSHYGCNGKMRYVEIINGIVHGKRKN